MKQAFYRNKDIRNITSLAKALHFPLRDLIRISKKPNIYYRANTPKIKPNGKLRQTFSIIEPLKTIQENILHEILDDVDFPDYLMGSIKDIDSPRDYIRDASLHLGQEVVIKEDISDYFNSVRPELVLKMWKYFFNFSTEVAELLVKLTTYDGFIPQGSSTSSAISNLIFWNREPELEFFLRRKGYIYSRYVDDITVSFTNRVEKEELRNVTTRIYQMLFSYNLRPNRKKRAVQTRNKGIRIHGLNVGSENLSLPREERYKIRAAIKELEIIDISLIPADDFFHKYASINGRIINMARHHPHQAKKYRIWFEAIMLGKLLHDRGNLSL
jgi:hypothetical protein